MITFMTTLYNEEHELSDLMMHVAPYVSAWAVIDDGSQDSTPQLLRQIKAFVNEGGFDSFIYKTIPHTGSCELGRLEALKLVPADSWVIMLDADERFEDGVLPKITEWIRSNPSKTHMYFNQNEFIDGTQTRNYQKVKVFKKESAHLPEIIHGDPQFDGDPEGFGWVVIHRKSTDKQIQREIEYLRTYQQLLDEGKIDQDKFNWFVNMHYFVRSQ